MGAKKGNTVKNMIKGRVDLANPSTNRWRQSKASRRNLCCWKQLKNSRQWNATDIWIFGVIIGEVVPQDSTSWFNHSPHVSRKSFLERVAENGRKHGRLQHHVE